MNPDKVVLNSMMVTLTSTVSASVLPVKYGGNGSLPAPRLLFGTGLTYFGLSILADVAPDISGPICLAIAVTALTYYGVPILNNWLANNNAMPVGGEGEKPE